MAKGYVYAEPEVVTATRDEIEPIRPPIKYHGRGTLDVNADCMLAFLDHKVMFDEKSGKWGHLSFFNGLYIAVLEEHEDCRRCLDQALWSFLQAFAPEEVLQKMGLDRGIVGSDA